MREVNVEKELFCPKKILNLSKIEHRSSNFKMTTFGL